MLSEPRLHLSPYSLRRCFVADVSTSIVRYGSVLDVICDFFLTNVSIRSCFLGSVVCPCASGHWHTIIFNTYHACIPSSAPVDGTLMRNPSCAIR